MDAALVKHIAENAVEALSDAMVTLRLCERGIFAASDDHSMKDETERDLVSICHVLATVGRLVDWELCELEKIAAGSSPAARPIRMTGEARS